MDGLRASGKKATKKSPNHWLGAPNNIEHFHSMILEQACKHKRHDRGQYTRNISKFSHILLMSRQIYEKTFSTCST